MSKSLPVLAVVAALAAAPAVAWTQGAWARAEPGVQAAESTAPQPVEALQRMGAYLGTLQTFELTSETSLDLVMEDDQRIDLDGVTTYKVRRPDGFVIETQTVRKVRRFIFDGRRFTVYAPTRGYYASAEAPGTIREVLDIAYDRFGIVIPLEDIFHWGDPDALPTDFQSAEYIGPANVGGVLTDQYAFRKADIDWQVWIQQGDQPLPLKIAITDRTDPALPEFTARLSWTLNPGFTAQTFAFTPDGDDIAIPFHDPAGASR